MGEAVEHIIGNVPSEVTVLVIDDETDIRRTLEGIFTDEGYQCRSVGDGASALQLLREFRPSLVLLDIWMPGMDGLETLKRIKSIYPDLPVIMISGHASIATAITATKLGAADFIEKPLDLHATLELARRAIGRLSDGPLNPEISKKRALHAAKTTPAPSGSEQNAIQPVVFHNQAMRGRKIPQRTLRGNAILYGQGLHSGKKSGLILEPLPADSGIHFVGVSETTPVPAHVDFVESTGFATTVRLGQTQAGTIEHLMSALHAYGISNLLIKCNGEVPVMDGSAREFCELFDEIGLEDQEGEWYEIAPDRTLRVGDEREFIQLDPGPEFTIDYTLEYPEPVGKQRFVFTLGDVSTYKREIASARTFGFVKDIGALQRQGLALGGRFDNFVLIGEKGAINDNLRYPDEPVRHKILDALGDLYLLGRRISGKITARMTGHSDNIALLKLLRDELQAQ